MRFIRLSTLREQFPSVHFPLSESDQARLRPAFYASELSRNNSIPDNEQWLIQLQSEEFVLFLDWTEQERNLANLLDSSGKLVAFQNTTNVLQHALFSRFQTFISPFLYPQLLQLLKNSRFETWQAGLSYVPLLKEHEADLVQQVIYDQLKIQQHELENSIRTAKTEEQLLDAIRKHLTPDLVTTLNLFTPSFYRVKTAWMAIVKEVAHHKAGTKRLVLYLIKELDKLQLNPDHLTELRELDRGIKLGAVTVDELKIPAKRIVLLSISLILVIGLIYLIWIVPTRPEREIPQEKTAFMDFTVQERKAMDSLLNHATMEYQQQDDGIIDGSNMTYVGEELKVKIPWNNELAEELISQWKERDSTNQKPQSVDSKKESRPFPSTEPLVGKPGTISAKFQNDTELSVIVLVFKDRSDEWVYTQYIEKGGIVSFKLTPEEHMLVLPGSKVPKHLNEGSLPFHQVDSRFFENLDKAYVVDVLSPSKVKFVWKSLNNFDFFLLDLNGALNM